MRNRIAVACAALAVLGHASHGNAGLVGDTVRVSRLIPARDFVFGPFTFVAQAGPADKVAMSTGNNHYFDVEDASLRITFGPQNAAGGPFAPLEHFDLFEDLSPTAPVIRGVTVETNVTGFLPQFVTFTPHTVTIGQGGLDFPNGRFITVNLQFVPEPSGFLLGMVVLAGVPAIRARVRPRSS